MKGRKQRRRTPNLVKPVDVTGGAGGSQVLPTSKGEALKSYFLAGRKLGVSSRGWATLQDNGDGIYIQDDFELITRAPRASSLPPLPPPAPQPLRPALTPATPAAVAAQRPRHAGGQFEHAAVC